MNKPSFLCCQYGSGRIFQLQLLFLHLACDAFQYDCILLQQEPYLEGNSPRQTDCCLFCRGNHEARVSSSLSHRSTIPNTPLLVFAILFFLFLVETTTLSDTKQYVCTQGVLYKNSIPLQYIRQDGSVGTVKVCNFCFKTPWVNTYYLV